MRIRTQVICSAVLAAALTAVTVLGLAQLARRGQAALEAQAASQQVALGIANVLLMTNEFVVFGGERPIAQWRARCEELRLSVEKAMRGSTEQALHAGEAPLPELLRLHKGVADLPTLFDALVAIGAPPLDPLAQRRRELLLERLLTQTQELTESRYRWAVALGEAQARDQRVHAVLALTLPGVLVLLLGSLCILLGRRVLAPLARLETAVRAIRSGDLAVRCGSGAADELGDAARAVDELALALQQRSAALSISEHRLRLLADSLPAAVAHMDTDQRYTYVNAENLRLVGKDPSGFVGRTLREMRGDAVYLANQGRVQQVLAGERVTFETSGGPGQPYQHRHTTFVPDVDDDGRVQGFYSMTFDITARKEAELRQAASEARLIDLINHLPAMVCYFDMGEHCRYANDAALHSRGLHRDGLTGMSLRELLGPAEYALQEPHVRQALQGRPAQVEMRSPFEGREAYFQAHFIPDRVGSGPQRGFYVMTFDITALKQAQQQQARVERQLRRIADNLPVMISYLDCEQRYLFANATFRDWLGLDPAALIGQRMPDVVRADHYEQRRPHLEQALAGERVEFDVETVMLGVARSLKIVYIPDLQPDGSVAGVYTLTSDVSALKAVERQLDLLARIDTLTGLPNRRHFDERLGEAIARAGRTQAPMALMFLDVDHFKSINDRLGHAAGDAVLREFAARLRETVRTTDLAARLAGDEFVVLIEDIGAEHEAVWVARKVIAAMHRPFDAGGTTLTVTASVGVAYAEEPRSDIELMARADEALYAAKAAGRNTFRLNNFSALRH